MQTITYDSFTGVFKLYRGGYDEKTKSGLDPYHREFEPLTEAKGYKPVWHGVADGILLFMRSEYSRNAIEFFFGKYFDESKSQIIHGNWSVCFDGCGRLVFFESDAHIPERITTTYKTRCKSYNEWVTPNVYSYNDEWPRIVSAWKFKSGTRYCIVDVDKKFLFKLLPIEYEKLGLQNRQMCTHEQYLLVMKDLYYLEPVDLNSSWDRTEEEKQEIQKQIMEIRNKKERAAYELERRKHTEGYCSCCGAENADYVADPYDEEIYGKINMRWLCSECYHDIAMDV